MRYSKQREVILNIVKQSYNHPDAEYIYNEVRKIIPNISLGTVYRNLKALVETGEIIKISGLEDKEHYDKTVHDHIHFICEKCKEVIDYHDYDFKELENKLENKFDFKVNNYNFTIIGICHSCQNKEEEI